MQQFKIQHFVASHLAEYHYSTGTGYHQTRFWLALHLSLLPHPSQYHEFKSTKPVHAPPVCSFRVSPVITLLLMYICTSVSVEPSRLHRTPCPLAQFFSSSFSFNFPSLSGLPPVYVHILGAVAASACRIISLLTSPFTPTTWCG